MSASTVIVSTELTSRPRGRSPIIKYVNRLPASNGCQAAAPRTKEPDVCAERTVGITWVTSRSAFAFLSPRRGEPHPDGKGNLFGAQTPAITRLACTGLWNVSLLIGQTAKII